MTNIIRSRLNRLLNYVHSNLDKPLLVDEIANVIHCSRWQIQRDFTQVTGLSVADYVRRLKLSKAATLLLESNDKQVDIVVQCGFDSEISFHRSFKRQHGCTPGKYRKRGEKIDIQLPLDQSEFIPLRIEKKSEFSIVGVSSEMTGVLSLNINAHEKVPVLWDYFMDQFKRITGVNLNTMLHTCIGGIDTSKQNGLLNYWACITDESPYFNVLKKDGFNHIQIPEQHYLVLTHHQSGKSQSCPSLAEKISWIIEQYLPTSGYQAIQSFDLETRTVKGVMEYWFPVMEIKPD
jgi:AraC family transcriptional regulator